MTFDNGHAIAAVLPAAVPPAVMDAILCARTSILAIVSTIVTAIAVSIVANAYANPLSACNARRGYSENGSTNKSKFPHGELQLLPGRQREARSTVPRFIASFSWTDVHLARGTERFGAPAARDYRTFECAPCDQTETVITDDPMKSEKAGWLQSELKPPQWDGRRLARRWTSGTTVEFEMANRLANLMANRFAGLWGCCFWRSLAESNRSLHRERVAS
jgi:hypothetical protein